MISGKDSGGNPVAPYVLTTELKINANHRYVLSLSEDHTVGISVADFNDNTDSGSVATPKDSEIKSITADNAKYNGTAQVFQFEGTQLGDKVTFTVKSTYGTNVSPVFNYAVGKEVDLTQAPTVKKTKSVITYLGAVEVTDTYEVVVPVASTGVFDIKMTILSPGNPKNSKTISFVQGAIDLSTPQGMADAGFSDENFVDALEEIFGTAVITPEMMEQTTTLNLSGNTDMTSLDGIENFPNLTVINTVSNTNLTGKVDLTGNPELISASFGETGITEIDLSGNPKLTYLNLNNTAITEIDLSHNPKLTGVYIAFVPITEIDLSNNPELLELHLSYTEINEIDFSHNPKLIEIRLTHTNIPEIEFNNFQNLKTVHLKLCDNLSAISVNNCRVLDNLQVSQCPNLTTVNLGDTDTLTYLSISDSKVSSLDISNNKNLTVLGVSNLGTLDMTVWQNFSTDNKFTTYNKAGTTVNLIGE